MQSEGGDALVNVGSSLLRQVVSKNRSPPVAHFGSDTRNSTAKLYMPGVVREGEHSPGPVYSRMDSVGTQVLAQSRTSPRPIIGTARRLLNEVRHAVTFALFVPLTVYFTLLTRPHVVCLPGAPRVLARARSRHLRKAQPVPEASESQEGTAPGGTSASKSRCEKVECCFHTLWWCFLLVDGGGRCGAKPELNIPFLAWDRATNTARPLPLPKRETKLLQGRVRRRALLLTTVCGCRCGRSGCITTPKHKRLQKLSLQRDLSSFCCSNLALELGDFGLHRRNL